MTSPVYDIITEKILEALETGTVPWRKPWTAGTPRNAVSNRPYSGINPVLLGLAPYSDQRWCTLKQANQLRGKIRKGEKSTIIIFWKMNEKAIQDGEGQEGTRAIPMIRYYRVFNVEQCEGLNLAPLPTNHVDPIAEAEAIIANMPKPPSIDHDGGARAYYRPSTDSIHLPARRTFHSGSEYYATTLHELSHSTGHPKRLNRHEWDTVAPFGSETYSKEELVAEFGASFLCAHAGIDNVLDNASAYIKGWMKALKSDPRLVVTAASQGQKAADHILDVKE